MPAKPKQNPSVVSAVTARANLDKMLRRVKSEKERFVIQRRGQPEAVLMSFEDYLDLVAPAPEWLQKAWKAAEENGADKMTMEEIDAVIAEVRREREAGKDAQASRE